MLKWLSIHCSPALQVLPENAVKTLVLPASREDMACSSQTHPARSSDALVTVKSQRRARHLKNIFEEGSVEEPGIKLLLGML